MFFLHQLFFFCHFALYLFYILCKTKLDHFRDPTKMINHTDSQGFIRFYRSAKSIRASLTVELKEGKLRVYSISEAKLSQFRDGGTLAGRLNDTTYTLFTCAVSFLVACLTTNSDVFMYVLATLTCLICLNCHR